MTSPVSISPGFCAEAFSLTPDPQRLFLSRDHAEALAGLKLGLEYRRGLMVVVGEVGMGKTTVAYSLLATLGDQVRSAYIANTRVAFDGLLRHALEDFGVECAEGDRAGLLSALKAFLLDCAEVDEIAVLVVDEAQSLDDETFENLRLLSNVETYKRKLLQIVLLGQPELDARLRQPQLRQIADRVGVRVNINPLDRVQSRRYIEHRLERAGGSLAMFSEPALRSILRHGRGVPRRMNILCHNALLLAYAAGAPAVTRSMAREAVREHAGGTLLRLARSPGKAGLTERGPLSRSWAAAGAALVAGGFLIGTGLIRPAATPQDIGAATVPLTFPAEQVPDRVCDRDVATAGLEKSHAAEVNGDDAPPVAVATGEAPDEGGAAVGPVEETSAGGAADPSAPVEVTVGRGATLMSIARQFYGEDSPELIKRILQANPWVSDPNVILAGSKLVLPRKGS